MRIYKIEFANREPVIGTTHNHKLALAIAEREGGTVVKAGNKRQDQDYLRTLENVTEEIRARLPKRERRAA